VRNIEFLRLEKSRSIWRPESNFAGHRGRTV